MLEKLKAMLNAPLLHVAVIGGAVALYLHKTSGRWPSVEEIGAALLLLGARAGRVVDGVASLGKLVAGKGGPS